MPPIPRPGNGSGSGDGDDVAQGQLHHVELDADVLDRPARHRGAAVIHPLLALLHSQPEPVDELLREQMHVGARVQHEPRLETTDAPDDERSVRRRAVGALEGDRHARQDVDVGHLPAPAHRRDSAAAGRTTEWLASIRETIASRGPSRHSSLP